MRRRALLMLLPLAACASPEPDLYRLTPVAGTPLAAGTGLIELRRIGLPGYLDRNSIVRSGAGARLEVFENARWAEPLAPMAARVLAEDLGQRLPGRTVLSEDSALRVDGDVVVEVDVQRFEADGAGGVALVGQAALRRFGERDAARARTARPIRVTVPLPDPGPGGVVQGMSAALGRLADELAGLLAR